MFGIRQYRLWLLLLAFITLPIAFWLLGSGPVLLHVRALGKADYRPCGAYYEQGTGLIVLNPFRSRVAERIGDTFLSAVSKGKCTPDLNGALCKFVREHALPATQWSLVNRQDRGNEIDLFYRLSSPLQAKKDVGCLIVEVRLERVSGAWRVVSYGVSG